MSIVNIRVYTIFSYRPLEGTLLPPSPSLWRTSATPPAHGPHRPPNGYRDSPAKGAASSSPPRPPRVFETFQRHNGGDFKRLFENKRKQKSCLVQLIVPR